MAGLRAALHWPLRFEQVFVAADEGEHVAIAHLLGDGGGKHRPIAATAVHDYFTIRVGKHLFEVALQNAFADMNGLGGVILLPFVVLAHIHEDGLGVFGEPLASFIDSDLLHVGPRLVNQFQKSG